MIRIVSVSPSQFFINFKMKLNYKFFFSDVKIKLEKEEVFAHKLVLSARNQSWGSLPDHTTLGKHYFKILSIVKFEFLFGICE
jgi:hypothetical protein